MQHPRQIAPVDAARPGSRTIRRAMTTRLIHPTISTFRRVDKRSASTKSPTSALRGRSRRTPARGLPSHQGPAPLHHRRHRDPPGPSALCADPAPGGCGLPRPLARDQEAVLRPDRYPHQPPQRASGLATTLLRARDSRRDGSTPTPGLSVLQPGQAWLGRSSSGLALVFVPPCCGIWLVPTGLGTRTTGRHARIGVRIGIGGSGALEPTQPCWWMRRYSALTSFAKPFQRALSTLRPQHPEGWISAAHPPILSLLTHTIRSTRL